MDLNQLREFYIAQIQKDFLPYWLKFVDREQGGILNCIKNRGDQLLSENKFTWSQGRWLWVLARIYMLVKAGVLDQVDAAELEPLMEGTFRFLAEKSIYGPKDECCYLLTRNGEKLVDERTGRYDASIYADCFALIGVSQYAKAVHSEEARAVADRLYRSIVERVESNDFLTEPYPVPEGYAVHGVPMILINTTQEYMDMRVSFGLETAEQMAYAKEKLRFILEDLYDEERGLIREHFSGLEHQDRLLDAHINPGHTLEDAWFWLEFLEEYGDLEKYLPRICRIAKNSFALGWDAQYGGLLRFVDHDGGQPHGKCIGTPYEELIRDTWDMKLWWPHAEILYLFLHLYTLTGDEEFAQLYQKSADYVFSVFPNSQVGEWTQILQRDGTPEEKVVALPVKDPFHILRDYIKIVELLTKGR